MKSKRFITLSFLIGILLFGMILTGGCLKRNSTTTTPTTTLPPISTPEPNETSTPTSTPEPAMPPGVPPEYREEYKKMNKTRSIYGCPKCAAQLARVRISGPGYYYPVWLSVCAECDWKEILPVWYPPRPRSEISRSRFLICFWLWVGTMITGIAIGYWLLAGNI